MSQKQSEEMEKKRWFIYSGREKKKIHATMRACLSVRVASAEIGILGL